MDKLVNFLSGASVITNGSEPVKENGQSNKSQGSNHARLHAAIRQHRAPCTPRAPRWEGGSQIAKKATAKSNLREIKYDSQHNITEMGRGGFNLMREGVYGV